VTRRALRDAVTAGALSRLREGVYCHPATAPDLRDAAAHGGIPACVSAAAALGLWLMPYEGLHIAVPMRGRVHRHPACACRVHRSSGPAVFGTREPAAQALQAILRCQGDEAFVVALESGLRRGVVGSSERAALRRRVPAGRRWLVDFARCDADSGLESLVRFRLHAHGIAVRSQVEVPGVGRVDFVIGDRLIIEIDGKGNHEAAPRRHRDLVRDAIAAGLGFETLRFDYAMIMHDWPTVLAVVIAKIEARAHLA
jgi:very-short-patch-repair endonuclease